VLAVQSDGKDVPGVQKAVVRRLNSERGDLVMEEAEHLGGVEVFRPCHLEGVKIDGMGL
jgi:hypothetical protein